MSLLMLVSFEGAVRLMVAGPRRGPAVQRMLAELEFALATALPAGPVELLFGAAGPAAEPTAAPIEPWMSLSAEGVRGFRLRPGLAHDELAQLLSAVASEPPRQSDRRTELWMAGFEHVDLVTADPSIGTDPALARSEARRRLDPGAPKAMQPPLPDDDVRALRAAGRLAWLREASAPPQEVPAWPTGRTSGRAASGDEQWHRLVHLALAAEGCGRSADATPVAPPIVLGAFDALLDSEDAAAVTDLLVAVQASTWAEASVLGTELLRPERLRRLIKLVHPNLLAGASTTSLGELVYDEDPEVRAAALQLLDQGGDDETLGVFVAAIGAEAFLGRPAGERANLLRALGRYPVGRYSELLLELLDRPGSRAHPALVETQIEAVGLLARDGVAQHDQALRRRARRWTLHRKVRRAVRTALNGRDAS